MSAQGPTPTFVPGYDACTQTSIACPISLSLYGYAPNLGANIFFAVFFGILVVLQFASAFIYKTWSFGSWILVGLALEFAGYVSRIFLHRNVWNSDAFRAQLVCLILAPSFLAAAISVTFKHLIIYTGQKHSKLRANWYPYVFIGTDLMSIFIQAIGGGIAASATNSDNTNEALLDAGNGMLVAGVAFQVANMAVCGVILLSVMWNYQKAKKRQTPVEHDAFGNATKSQYELDRLDPKYRRNLWIFTSALGLTYITILIRCIYRIPEMAGGWGGSLMREEIPFIILDGAMISIASLTMTIFHPGRFARIFKHEGDVTGLSSEKKRASSSAVSDEESSAPSQLDEPRRDTAPLS